MKLLYEPHGLRCDASSCSLSVLISCFGLLVIILVCIILFVRRSEIRLITYVFNITVYYISKMHALIINKIDSRKPTIIRISKIIRRRIGRYFCPLLAVSFLYYIQTFGYFLLFLSRIEAPR